MPRRRRRLSRPGILKAAVIGALTLGCGGAATAQSAGDTVRVSCSGGDNGGSSGWVLAANGGVARFAGRSELTYVDAGRDSLAVARVFAELDRIGLRSRPDSALPPMPDAITCAVTIGSGEGRRGIRWLYGRIPPVIEPALATIDSAVGAGQGGAWRNRWQKVGDVWP